MATHKIRKPEYRLDVNKASYPTFVRTVIVDESENPYENERAVERAARQAKIEEQAYLESTGGRIESAEPPPIPLLELPDHLKEELAQQFEPIEFVIGEEVSEEINEAVA